MNVLNIRMCDYANVARIFEYVGDNPFMHNVANALDEMKNSTDKGVATFRTRGYTHYEPTNHLGNVLAV
jgi:hypothetical protein